MPDAVTDHLVTGQYQRSRAEVKLELDMAIHHLRRHVVHLYTPLVRE